MLSPFCDVIYINPPTRQMLQSHVSVYHAAYILNVHANSMLAPHSVFEDQC
jgi:hypothetical protein